MRTRVFAGQAFGGIEGVQPVAVEQPGMLDQKMVECGQLRRCSMRNLDQPKPGSGYRLVILLLLSDANCELPDGV